MKGKHAAALVVVGVLLGLAIPFFSRQEAHGQRDEKKQQWEYKLVERHTLTELPALIKEYNELGAEGWEFVGSAGARQDRLNSQTLLIFKRAKK